MKKGFYTLLLFALLVQASKTWAQARLMIDNGGIININGGSAGTSIYLVIDNPNPNAITRTGSGHIISEGEYNKIKWNIGTTAGTYTIPFGIGAATYIPNAMTTSGAVGASGSLTFSTYPTGTWLNSAFMPAGMLHVNSYLGMDNSYSVIDRFWRIQPENYTTKPAMSNMLFSYRDIEWSAASNIITEANLVAQRYNDVTHEWGDYMPGGTGNTVANNVSGAAVPNTPTQHLYTWWTLVDFQSPLPVELTAFNAKCETGSVKLFWETASESNNSFFEIERSADGFNFVSIGRVYSQNGNSNQPQSYTFADASPLNGTAYYRLKQVDTDNKFSYSAIVRASCAFTGTVDPVVTIFPNPAIEQLTVDVKNLPGNKRFIIFNLLAQEMTMKTEAAKDAVLTFDVSHFAKATYILHLDVDGEFYQAIKFVKE